MGKRRCRLWSRVFVFFCIFFLLLTTLPYDNPIRLSVRFNLNVLGSAALPPSSSDDRWLFNSRASFPLTNPSDDIAVIVKSGFGTQDRISAWLEAHEDMHLANLLVVADFSAESLGQYYRYDGRAMPVHDMIASMLEKGSLPSRLSHHPRLRKYLDLTHLARSGQMDLARQLCKSVGWELDAMKFISSLELAYHQMPRKKWYILVDDDTYLVRPSFLRLLEHVDPSECHYIGNPVGDYKARFAHGGSSVILSRATMDRLFSHRDIVSNAHITSLEEKWGDKLLAMTLIKIGVYLEEQYGRLFNGRPPQTTKFKEDRLCAPVVSFHALSSVAMRSVHRILKKADKPVRWVDLWDLYGAPSLDTFAIDPVRFDWDHVGKLDETTSTTENVATAERCARICSKGSSGSCLAWTWEAEKEACHISPWMAIGTHADRKVSGLHVQRIKRLTTSC